MKISWSLLASAAVAYAITISEINGNSFVSFYEQQAVTDVKGIVTAKSKIGFYMRSTEPDFDIKTSESIFVLGQYLLKKVNVGDVVSLDAIVDEYRDDIPSTQLVAVRNLAIKSKNNPVFPAIIGEHTPSPPTEQFTSLDGGSIHGFSDGSYSLSDSNPILDPEKYGLDFWESLSGEFVTIRSPKSVSRSNNRGDTWVIGDWGVTGRNSHGGMTISATDFNPEVIKIGRTLDDQSNPIDTKMGDELADITGIVTYKFGFYTILPVEPIQVIKRATSDYPPTSLVSTGDCSGITVTSYNTHNLHPTAPHMAKVVRHIVDHLKTPDILLLQEIQDSIDTDNRQFGGADDVMRVLSNNIKRLSDVKYSWALVQPKYNKEGGRPGSNIRQAYLYRPDVVKLVNPTYDDSLSGTQVYMTPDYELALSLNPGRIDPFHPAWYNSRKPLVAMWYPVRGAGKPFFTINVHLTSKGGSTSIQGDIRPPINYGVQKRAEQLAVIADFITQIMSIDHNARIIVGGDFNDFSFAEPMANFMEHTGMVDLNDVVRIPPEERYSFVHGMTSEELDPFLISPALIGDSHYEHVHLNSWQKTGDSASDHDPQLGRFNMCY
ncbi:uncharacterized protein BROUX77_001878 [Berkeleyomyces rouxiae]|uniref:uncharacterized protein n=1 Tax=Berkeleyomyces rouxiae TaxID=2035830 RepID=UPI003B7F426E